MVIVDPAEPWGCATGLKITALDDYAVGSLMNRKFGVSYWYKMVVTNFYRLLHLSRASHRRVLRNGVYHGGQGAFQDG